MTHPLSAADYLARLVAFPTVSAVSNLAMTEAIEAMVAPYGGRCRRFPNAAGDKANLLVTFGPEVPGGVLFSGHMDVVPCEGQDWTGDPWTLRQVGERVIGRGATDMKGFLACCLAAMPAIAATPLQRPVHFAFSYDEEVGCTGVGSMAEWIGASAMRPRLAVIGEPSNMELITAHKGGMIGWAHVKGVPGHSSQPDKYVNAVMIAAELVAEINRIRQDMKDGPQLDLFDPPYSTIQVNQIRGGLHGNIVAEDCAFFWEMRVVPGTDDREVFQRFSRHAAEVLEPAMKRISPEAGIRFDVMSRIPLLAPLGDSGLEAELLGLLGQSAPRGVSYGTEAGIFAAAGIPSVVCGPGDIADAHQPDEGIAIAQLEACVAFVARLAGSCRD
ncbi:MAG: acetylornithine deacetylase [Rhodobacterales bacterium]|nr:acetylornithine deacetylase [Rhodobacterales bacterium]MDX5501570.1 acetylornithine deacetylase [Rhodobacterales bacterium]